jgi:DNA-binding transcriptional LysR family regulator
MHFTVRLVGYRRQSRRGQHNITIVNARTMDLNLLPVLDAVLAEGNATRAAARLGLTQPAVSNALARLRKVFGDPLVVKSRRGLAPTPRAIELRDELASALALLDQAVRPKEAFSLATTRRQWSLGFAEHYGQLLLPGLMRWVEANAPLTSVRVVPLERMIVEDALAGGGVDLYVGIPAVPMPGCHARRFFDDELVCVGREGAAPVRTLDQLLARGHIKAEVTRGRGNELDDALTPLRRSRRVTLVVPSYASALEVVARTDLVSIVPRGLAERSAHRVWVTTLPVALAPLTVSMFWHRRVHADAGVKALRAGLLALVGTDRRLLLT